jgi:integrase
MMHREMVTMAREFKMTWHPPRQCWYVKKDGRRYYCPIKCRGKTTDKDGYSNSLAWWEEKKRELENVPKVASSSFPPIEKADRQLIKKVMADERRTEEDATLQVLGWKEQDAQLQRYGPTEVSAWLAMERDRLAAAAAPKHDTMEIIVKKFLDFKVSQAVTGMKSAGRAINLVTYLKQFKAFVGADRPVKDITAMTLFDFHAKTVNDMATGQLTDYAARDRLQVAKQFIRWAWELNLIDLPRNINSKELTIYVEQKEIKVFDANNLAPIINSAPEPLKVHLLLMANCGMTAMDVGDLRNNEIDFAAGTITRIRSKRKKKRGASSTTETGKVKVQWKLWPLTLELLRKNANKSGDFAFTSGDGGQIAYTKIDPVTYKGCDVDLIDKAYRAHCRDSKIAKKNIRSLKQIRATSATLIGHHKDFARYSQYFLGHAPRSVAEKFYIKPSQDQFDECVCWLGKHYGFISA